MNYLKYQIKRIFTWIEILYFIKYNKIISRKLVSINWWNIILGGLSGVFEIQDLVQVLKRENAVDIFVAKVPNELNYVDYMCIVSGKSQKHMQAVVQFVRRVYKQKMKGDVIPRTEGAKSKDWIALDLGKNNYFIINILNVEKNYN